jgi:hypothetical protein
MNSRLRTYVLAGGRAFLVAGSLAVLTPGPAHADDLWCRIFGVGCGGSGSTTASSTERDAPEIDPGALASAIALAAGGAAILRGRVRRRR